MSRIMWGVLGLAAALCSLSGANATSSEEARIPLDDANQIWVQRTDGTWIHWISSAPGFVNRDFVDRYVADLSATTAPLPSGPVEIGWWVFEDHGVNGAGDLVSTVTLTDDRETTDPYERRWGPNRYRLYVILRFACTGSQLSVAVGFDQDQSGEPRRLEPRHASGRGGQIAVWIWAQSRDGDTGRHLDHRNRWWDLTRDYRWAYAPDPMAVVEHLRGQDSMWISADEHKPFEAYSGSLPVRGFAEATSRLSCLGGQS